MGAPAYQVTNLETCSPRQVALLVLGFFGLWATLYGLGASAPPLYVSQLLPPTLPGALAAVGGCELYALLHAYVYLPVSWVGRDDGHDDDDDEL